MPVAGPKKDECSFLWNPEMGQKEKSDFIKFGCTAQITEISLSICTLHLGPTFEKLFTGINVQPKAPNISAGCKTVYEIYPRSGWEMNLGPSGWQTSGLTSSSCHEPVQKSKLFSIEIKNQEITQTNTPLLQQKCK